jgi:carbamoyl-phosphate synthase small subunit
MTTAPASQGEPHREQGFVLLEDGTRFDGLLAGAREPVTGEVVFNTSMTGYQEAVTDPSYAGQIITFTYPLIGNYGVAGAATESERVQARGVIMREGKNHFAAASPPDTPVSLVRSLQAPKLAGAVSGGSGLGPLTGTPENAAEADGGWLDWLRDTGTTALDGVDTRALVRHIRDRGAMRGGIFSAELGESVARDLIAGERRMDGADLAREVTPDEPLELEGEGPHVVGIDTGIKRSIVRQFRERGCRLTLLPCTASTDEVLARDPDLVFLANGPGDPAALDYVVETVRGVVGRRPVVGICLGHQLLCRAVGLGTFKLPFGHRGANHPVKDLSTGRIEITSQNHGFAVQGPGGEPRIEDDEPVRWETDFGAAELSHLNLYDRTVEGLVLLDVPGATVQYHPEAGPGPHDARHLFDRFMELAGA